MICLLIFLLYIMCIHPGQQSTEGTTHIAVTSFLTVIQILFIEVMSSLRGLFSYIL
uniref:Uncharacterized protein n=1 Tax=Rhizophora mucronata TaxID=61149 RepID=A0A2P2MZS5_RHIMU